MIAILINFQGNFPICVMDDDLEHPRTFESFIDARDFIDNFRPDYRMACASICIVDIDTGESETI